MNSSLPMGPAFRSNPVASQTAFKVVGPTSMT